MTSAGLLLSVLLPLVYTACQQEHLLLFPEVSNSSYVEFTPLKPLSLKAFTLCLRLSVDPDVVNQKDRETIIFAYRTLHSDELNVWLEKSKITLYFRSSVTFVAFNLPPLTAFRTNLCLTWDSSTGLTALWVDGRRSLLRQHKKNHVVEAGGVVLVGQDPDRLLGDFDEKQSFVGEITDVYMWDYVLLSDRIKDFSVNVWLGPVANVLNWKTMQYKVHGNVLVVPEQLGRTCRTKTSLPRPYAGAKRT